MSDTTTRPPHHEHDWLSPKYVDDWVADWANRPERPDQLRGVAAAVPIDRDAAISVLDVGGGWGPLTEQVLAYRPHATVTLADYSAPMLDHARRYLASYATRVHLDLTDPSWAGGLSSFDAVVSALAVHNLRRPEVVARVYADIRRLLRPGGWFFNLEVVFPAGAAAGLVARRLQAFNDGNEPDPSTLNTPVAGNPGASTEPVPMSLEHQLVMLRGAGFPDVDCLWREGALALLCARNDG
jgi:tRNA (cmo5U34)-methyltransferase